MIKLVLVTFKDNLFDLNQSNNFLGHSQPASGVLVCADGNGKRLCHQQTKYKYNYLKTLGNH
jgi:hypothetical protein